MNSVLRFDKKGSWSKRKMPVLQTGDSGAIPDGSIRYLAQQDLDDLCGRDVRTSCVVTNRMLCRVLFDQVVERKTHGAQNAAPLGMGVQISPWSFFGLFHNPLMRESSANIPGVRTGTTGL